MKKEEIF